MVVAATPTLARALKHDPAHAVLIGAGSPLVLLSLIGGSHNDALMIGLLVAGLAVAKRFGTVPGVMLCALAAGVKSPALLGVLFLGWVWAGKEASTRRRIGHTAVAGLIALATMETVALISGTGWGWVRTTSTADASFTGVTPVNVVARSVSIVSHIFQVPISTLTVRPVFSVLGLLIAVYVGYRLLLRSPQEGLVRCLGLTMLVLALLGPIVWAWYVTWGVIVVAPAAIGRLRSALIVISTFWAFAGMTAVHGIYMRLIHTFVLTDLLLVAMLLAVAITPLGQFTPVRRTHLPRLTPGVLAGTGAGATHLNLGPRPSVGQVEGRHDAAGTEAHHQLAGDAVAGPVLLCSGGAHVAPAEPGRPPTNFVEVVADFGHTLHHHEAEGSIVVHTDGGSRIPLQVPTLHGRCTRVEDQCAVAVDVVPDRRQMRSAVGAHGGQLGRPGRECGEEGLHLLVRHQMAAVCGVT